MASKTRVSPGRRPAWLLCQRNGTSTLPCDPQPAQTGHQPQHRQRGGMPIQLDLCLSHFCRRPGRGNDRLIGKGILNEIHPLDLSDPVLLALLAACGGGGGVTPPGATSTSSLPTAQVTVIPAPSTDASLRAFLGALQSNDYASMYKQISTASQAAISEADFSKRYSDALDAMESPRWNTTSCPR